MCMSLCVRGWRDYSPAFTLSGERDGSASSMALPIPDHSPGISGLLSHTESTALNSPSTGLKSSELLTFSALFCSLTHPFHLFGASHQHFCSYPPPSEVGFWCEKTVRLKGSNFLQIWWKINSGFTQWGRAWNEKSIWKCVVVLRLEKQVVGGSFVEIT